MVARIVSRSRFLRHVWLLWVNPPEDEDKQRGDGSFGLSIQRKLMRQRKRVSKPVQIALQCFKT